MGGGGRGWKRGREGAKAEDIFFILLQCVRTEIKWTGKKLFRSGGTLFLFGGASPNGFEISPKRT